MVHIFDCYDVVGRRRLLLESLFTNAPERKLNNPNFRLRQNLLANFLRSMFRKKKVLTKPRNFLPAPSNARPKALVETIHVTYDDKLLGPLNRKYIIQIPRCKLNSSN